MPSEVLKVMIDIQCTLVPVDL